MKDALQNGLNKAGVNGAKKHLFLCIGPDCCSSAEGEIVWEFLKSRVRESSIPVMRTKAACFRVCTGGPILVVYPDGIWYSQVSVEKLGRIIDEHVLGGAPVSEWIIARNPLCSSHLAM